MNFMVPPEIYLVQMAIVHVCVNDAKRENVLFYKL